MNITNRITHDVIQGTGAWLRLREGFPLVTTKKVHFDSVVRELLCGSHRFNDIHRGVPRMSATLLTAAGCLAVSSAAAWLNSGFGTSSSSRRSASRWNNWRSCAREGAPWWTRPAGPS